MYDYLVVGAGLYGSVFAQQAKAAGKTVLADDVEQLLAEEQPIPDLSPRQREILESITQGLSNAQIALQLDISAESVKTHMSKLFAKLGAASRAEAVAIALRKRLLRS